MLELYEIKTPQEDGALAGGSKLKSNIFLFVGQQWWFRNGSKRVNKCGKTDVNKTGRFKKDLHWRRGQYVAGCVAH